MRLPMSFQEAVCVSCLLPLVPDPVLFSQSERTGHALSQQGRAAGLHET
jgi:hypothetical protein